jgi:hypothetical protein
MYYRSFVALSFSAPPGPLEGSSVVSGAVARLRIGCVDVCHEYRNGGDAVLACDAPTLLTASERAAN